MFRANTAYEASLRQVIGWVRNLRDGRVEALFEGEKEAIEAMIDFCWHGPKYAKVTNVEVEWIPYIGDLNSFETR